MPMSITRMVLMAPEALGGNWSLTYWPYMAWILRLSGRCTNPLGGAGVLHE